MTPQKHILITGAAGGIGQAIAEKLGGVPARLILTDVNLASLEKLSTELSATTLLYAVDLDNHEERERFCSELKVKFGEIDWIIHSAGFISEHDNIKEINDEAERKIFTINFFAPFHLTKRLQTLVKDGGGVIFISSTAGLSGNGFAPTYASSKGALNAFAHSLALSWQETTKRSVVLCPGPTNTPMRQEMARDSSQHQSPMIVAETIKDIVQNPILFKNNATVVLRNGVVEIL